MIGKKKLSEWEKRLARNINKYASQVESSYYDAIDDAAMFINRANALKEDEMFSLKNNPQLKKAFNNIINTLYLGIYTSIINGTKKSWDISKEKNNILVKTFLGNNSNANSRSQEALDAFIKRRTNGLNLSDRVWKYTDQFKSEIEMSLSLGIKDGVSATKLATQMKKYLQNPDSLFRRVRDEYGQLQLSKAAKNYHSGQGVYRSSYKNALRLTRSEINIAYRTADFERWQEMDFVVGIKVELSNNHTLNGRAFTDICDDLKGSYPKDFKFTGWHIACRCHAIPLFKGDDKEVSEVPDNFTEWIEDNEERIEKASERGTLPYFLKGNEKYAEVD
jgi:hypothetical protein